MKNNENIKSFPVAVDGKIFGLDFDLIVGNSYIVSFDDTPGIICLLGIIESDTLGFFGICGVNEVKSENGSFFFKNTMIKPKVFMTIVTLDMLLEGKAEIKKMIII